MTDDDLTDVVIDQAREQVDVQELLSGGNVADQIDSSELGAAVGASVGESLGRAFGRSVGRHVHRALSESLSSDTSREELVNSLKSGIRDGIRHVSVDDGRASSIVTLVRDALVGEEEKEVTDDTDEMVDDGEDEDEEAIDDDAAEERSADDGEPESDDSADDTDSAEADPSEMDTDDLDPSDVEIADLEELRTETLEAYLETISYRQLQTIAKDVDVTANLKREEMTDRIVDTVTGESTS